MQIDQETLKKAATAGSQRASAAFSKLAGEKVEVKASVAEVLSYDFITAKVKPKDQKTLITCTQMIDGVKGVSILTTPREAAFILVDLLSHQDIGTTGCLKDLERSAIKETLNILSNAYLNALAQMIGTKLSMGLPYLMTAEHISHLLRKVQNRDFPEGKAIMFETALSLANHEVEADLFIIFNQEFADFMQNI